MIYLVNPFSDLEDLGVVGFCFEWLFNHLSFVKYTCIRNLVAATQHLCALCCETLHFILVIIIWCSTILSRNFYFRYGLFGMAVLVVFNLVQGGGSI